MAASINEAQILKHQPLANKELAERNLLIFQLCETVRKSEKDFLSFRFWWEDWGPESLSRDYANMLARRSALATQRLYASGYRPSAEPSWYEKLEGFFTAGGGVIDIAGLQKLAGKSILHDGGSVAVPNTTPTQTSFDRWVETQEWNRRSAQIQSHYKGLQTKYQNKY